MFCREETAKRFLVFQESVAHTFCAFAVIEIMRFFFFFFFLLNLFVYTN